MKAHIRAHIGCIAACSLIALTVPTPSLPAGAAGLPREAQQLVLAKGGDGYRLQLTTAALPPLGPRQVLMRVRAVALNRGDVDLLQPDPGHDHSGMVVGSDAAGDIVAVGSEVHDFRAGERVTNLYFNDWTDGPFRHAVLAQQHGANAPGVFAEYLVLDATSVAPMPDGLSYEQASTLPTAGLTAWTAMTQARRVRPGEVVLVQGTGGVSTFALQFAAAMGAHVVITSSSDAKLARARTLGATDLINYRTTPNWADRVRALTQQHGADLVVDVGGKATLAQSVASLADEGALALVGGLTGYDGTLSEIALIEKRARAQGIYVGSRADYERMAAFISAHHLHPVIDRVFPLAQYQQAIDYMKSGGFFGKIVVRWR